jgi:tetratricopeptide (TPR) repeat protein
MFKRAFGLALMLCLSGGAASTSFAQSAPPASSQLGRIDFPTSGKAAAQPHFIKGVLLLHSFEFEDAKEAFAAARKADPAFAMAYWGEALTHTHPLWRYRNREEGLKVLDALAPSPEARQAKAPTPREKAYLRAVDTLYAEADHVAALRAYEQAMGRVAREFPKDDEAQTLHAIAILATNAERRDFAVDMKAAAIVEDVFLRNPEHPGVLHYMIHAYDNPMHAPLGLRAARRYAKIAAGASHALHMTSHIFLASGMWDDAVASNEASWAASAARVKAKSLGVDANGFHAYLWLAYAYLQQGRYADARQVVDRTLAFARESGSPRTAVHYMLARAAFIVETRRTDNLPPALEPKSVAPVGRAADLSAEGLAAVHQGDADKAEAILAKLKEVAAKAGGSEAHQHGAAPAAAPAASAPTMPMSAADRAAIDIMTQQLTALVRCLRGEETEALALMTKAAEAEDAMPYEFGPPVPIKPSRELLGEMLLAMDKPAEAQKAFAAALRRAPGRALSLDGLAIAAEKNGDAAAAADARATLKANWQRADAGIQRPGTH